MVYGAVIFVSSESAAAFGMSPVLFDITNNIIVSHRRVGTSLLFLGAADSDSAFEPRSRIFVAGFGMGVSSSTSIFAP